MNIAFVAVKGVPVGGGIERVTEEIGSLLVERGHRVIVYSSRDYRTTEDTMYRGMEIRTVASINRKAFHKLSICFNATVDVLRRKDIDVVHYHGVPASIFSIFPRLRGVPTVVQTHGLAWRQDKWGLAAKTFFRLFDFTVAYFATKATAVSKTQQSYYEAKFGKEIAYIPNGVSPVEKRGPEWILEQGLQPDKYILFAARLVEGKGADFLIPAFRAIETDMKLVIAGDAAYADNYKAKLRQLAGDDARILFPGFVTGRAMEELLSNAYLFCMPSTQEGLPVALLDAMNYGNCCLASDIPENIEVMEDYGYTFKNRDQESLRESLSDLLVHPEKVYRIRSAAMEHVRSVYSWESAVEQMEALYSSVVKRR